MKEIFRQQNLPPFSPSFPDSPLSVSIVIYQRALVDVSGMIITQMGKHNRTEKGRSAGDALYDTTP
jgi:hypothetical protein